LTAADGNAGRFAGFDDKIIALYARGLTTPKIAAHIGELYGTEISPELVRGRDRPRCSRKVAAWQSVVWRRTTPLSSSTRFG